MINLNNYRDTYKNIIIEDLELRKWLTKDMLDNAEMSADNEWVDAGDEESRIDMVSDLIKDEFIGPDKCREIYTDESLGGLRASNVLALGISIIAREIYADIEDDCWNEALEELGSPQEAIRDELELIKERRG